MYTRHDEVHIVNVMRIMWDLLGNSQERLTRDEAAMLVLAACCHDVGMSYSPDEKDEILDDIDSLNQYLEQHHGEYVKAYKDGSDMPKMTGEMIRTYLRTVHPQRASRWIHNQKWPDTLNGKVDKADVATVCQSHGNDVAALDTLEAKPNVDLRMCAILLRLADILDFDTSRSPRAIYDYCGFNRKTDPESVISREEWQKHMASHGFEFPPADDRAHPYELPYKATCTSMQIEQAIQSYLGWVDRELLGCSKELRLLDERWRGFVLPRQTKRIITPDGYVSGQYHLTLEQDKIIELLAGEDLYSDPSVFVRELLQNAIDAVRTRQQLDRNLPRNWKPQISIRTWMDNEGYHWFRIEDNGIGMTRTIIENYPLKVGSSYYASDEFEFEKIQCQADPSYTPISRFGIGILSCFMGDKRASRVEISTRHFGKGAHSLRLSMDGMSGYYYLADKTLFHSPGPMQGVTREERREYRQFPGTTVAVRTNLYSSGKYSGFKEIVDRYVMYPPVPIHYEDKDCCFDYPTEQEFMDAVHSLRPSDNLREDGLLEYPLPSEALKEIQDAFPELSWAESPRIQIKCYALDKYAETKGISGAILRARILGNLTGSITVGSRNVSVRLRLGLRRNYSSPHEFNNVLSYELASYEIIGDESHYISDLRDRIRVVADDFNFELDRTKTPDHGEYQYVLGDILQGKLPNRRFYKPTIRVLQFISDHTSLPISDIIPTMHFFTRMDTSVTCKFDLMSLPWCKKWFTRIAGHGNGSIAIHNGLIATDDFFSFKQYGSDDSLTICSVMLLADTFRPNLNLARNSIRSMPLHAHIRIEALLRKLTREDSSFQPEGGFLYGYNNTYIPASAYESILQEDDSLAHILVVELDDGEQCSVDSIQATKGFNDAVELQALENVQPTPYDNCCLAYLQKNYVLKFKRGRWSSHVYIDTKENRISDEALSLYPPAFFVKPLLDNDIRLLITPIYNDNDIRLLTYFYHGINSSHRLSKFLLSNAPTLHEQMPGIFSEFVRTLIEDTQYSKSKLVNNVNGLLCRIRSFPDSPIQVPDNVFITEDDLC